MTKEITKANILQAIQDKFKLRDWEADRFLFQETVVPTYDVGQHLLKWTVKQKTISITSGPQTYLFFTVPPDEKWLLRGYNVIFLATGAYKVTGLYINRAGAFIYLDMIEGQTVSYRVNLPVPVVLETGNHIYVYIDDYTSTANLNLVLDVQVEEIR